MAEFDFGEVFRDFGEVGRALGESSETKINMSDALDAIGKSESGKNFRDEFNTDLTKIEIESKGGEITYKNANGDTLTQEQFSNLTEGDMASSPPRPPDIEAAMKFLDPDLTQDFSKAQEVIDTAFNGSDLVKDLRAQTEVAAKVAARGISVKNEAEYAKLREENSALNEQLERAEEELKKTGEEGTDEKGNKGVSSKIGKFVKYVAFLAGGVLTYELIHSHMLRMNGCWLIHKNSKSKCKVERMSCDVDLVHDLCGNCAQEQIRCTGDTDGINNCAAGEVKGADFSGGCESPTNCGTCLTQCAEKGSCKGCSCSEYPCTPGTSLRCVDVDFMGAAADIIDSAIGEVLDLGSAMSSILKTFLIVAGVVVGAFLVFMFIKFVTRK